MGNLIYQIAMRFLASALKIAAPFNQKIKLGVEGRNSALKRLEELFSKQPQSRPVAWFHAASLGEFEQGRPVIEAYRIAYPDHFILLTFFSPSGYEVRKNYTGADFIAYLPIDTRANAAEFVRIVKPRIAFFIKYEFWLNYLLELKNQHCYIISFSSIFRPGQIFFKPHGFLHRQMLSSVDYFFVQNEASVQLLNTIGISSCSIAGDTRFDRVREIALNARDLPEAALFKSDKICLVAGSVWEADMEVLIPALNKIGRSLKAIIAPHEIKSEQIESWRKQLAGEAVRYSELKAGMDTAGFDYLIIDNIGMLSSLYRYGELAYIGGSFGAGLHNILEAATFGLPVIFGNKGYQRFQEAQDLVKLGGAFAIAGSTDISALLDKMLQNEAYRTHAGSISKDYVASGTGATAIIMDQVKEIMG
ncbi:3-deoxy-D-manno-octulosonic acid transferase [Dyadobacter crusticola]|uniref:3-deoxy-D-manno-octulosonic acid transferase n=1 Tax=Dyadobacter crusticola TaxID=292407 RepID=UPI0012F86327|nr:glycosyltransferase N-terminal domain-containing protein [Dyadobacter crusticola]